METSSEMKFQKDFCHKQRQRRKRTRSLKWILLTFFQISLFLQYAILVQVQRKTMMYKLVSSKILYKKRSQGFKEYSFMTTLTLLQIGLSTLLCSSVTWSCITIILTMYPLSLSFKKETN